MARLTNSYALKDYRLEVDRDGFRGLRAIEGNVDKLVTNTMKKSGMSCTIKGAQRMARLISLGEMGQLHSWITPKDKSGGRQLPEKTISKEPISKKDVETWLQATLPSLHGPQQNHPWVQILQALSHGALEV